MILILIQFVLFIIFLVASAFFAASETALTSVSLSAWDRLRREKPQVSSAYELWTGNPSLVMATLLFGNMVTSLGASAVAGALMRPIADHLGLSTGFFLLAGSLIAGTTILVLGDILPKLYARHYFEQVLGVGAKSLAWVVWVLAPLLKGLSNLADVIRRLFSKREREPLITREEISQALADSGGEGIVPSAKRMLTAIMGFDKIKVSEVMIPRSHVVAVAMEKDSERMFEHIVRSGFSRIPIFVGNIDHISGIIYAKDLLSEWRNSGLLVIEDLLRPPFRIAPDAALPTLLQGFRQGHHMAVVTDAQGRTQGIVTIEDVVEAIVGDVADEFDQRDT